MKNLFRQLISLCSTFWTLSLLFLRHRIGRNSTYAAIAISIGLFTPLPLIFVLLSSLALVNGDETVARTLFETDFSIDARFLLLCGVGAAIAIYIIRILVSNAILREARNWQKSLFISLIDRSTELNRIDVSFPNITVEDRVIHAWGTRLGQAGTQIALLFVYGMNSFAIIFGLSFLLILLNWKAMALLIVSSILLLPFYGLSMRGIRDTRKGLQDRITSGQATLKAYATAVRTKTQDAETVEIPEDDAFIGVNLTGLQHHHLLSLQLVAGFHIILVVAAIASLFPYFEMTLETSALTVFISYLLMRTAIGFVQLMGQLVRNYENLYLLKAFLKPRAKRGQNLVFLTQAGPVPLTPGVPQLAAGPMPKTKGELQRVADQIQGHTKFGQRINFLSQQTINAFSTAKEPAYYCVSPRQWRDLTESQKADHYWVICGDSITEFEEVSIVPGEETADPPTTLSIVKTRYRAASDSKASSDNSGAPARNAFDHLCALKPGVLRNMSEKQIFRFSANLMPDESGHMQSTPHDFSLFLFAGTPKAKPLPNDAAYRIDFKLTNVPQVFSFEVNLFEACQTTTATLFAYAKHSRIAWKFSDFEVIGLNRTVKFDSFDGVFLEHRFIKTSPLDRQVLEHLSLSDSL